MANFMDRMKRSLDVLRDKPPAIATVPESDYITSSGPMTPSFQRLAYDSQRAVLAPIVTRISIDVAAVPIRHVIADVYGNFLELRQSELNERLTVMANIDQSGVAFVQDAVTTMLTSGSCAMVPVEISQSPNNGDAFEILSMRVGEIVGWRNKSVEVSVYNENLGQRQTILLPKDFVAIAYNPMYGVMNESNSTLRRLVDRLALLDVADGKLFSPNLDLIVQLPYALKTQRRTDEAERRIAAIESQLEDSKRGIAYIDATERVTQLNRPVTNTLFETVTSLTESLHSQLGLTPAIFSGTAAPEEMLSYNNRTIMPIINALSHAMVGSFLTRTAISQGQTVMGMPTLFKMAPIGDLAEAADKFTRNEIMTTNEVRSELGLPPRSDEGADTLRNKNLNKATEEGAPGAPGPTPPNVESSEDLQGAI